MIAPVFLALALLNTVVLATVLRPPRSWAAKLLLILVVTSFSFTVIHARVSGAGWPVAAAPPDGAQLISCLVEEPTPGSNDGAIYLWALTSEKGRTLFGYTPGAGEPRAYRLRYSRALHAECVAARKAQARGSAVGISTQVPKGRRGRRSPVHFYQLPPPHFQQKEARP